MGFQGDCSGHNGGSGEVMEVNLTDVVETEVVQVGAGGKERVEHAAYGVNSDGVVEGEGHKTGLHNIDPYSTVALYINIFPRVFDFNREGRELCIMYKLVKLFLFVHSALILSCHIVARSGIVNYDVVITGNV